MLSRKHTLVALLILSTANVCLAGEPGPLPPQFSLSRYIPADFWFVASSAPNQKNQWMRDQWSRVTDALGESGIDDDLLALVSSITELKESNPNELGPRQWFKLLKGVEWCELLNGEIAIAERMRRGSLEYEYVLLAKSSPEKARKNMATMVKLFQSLSDAQDTIHLTHSRKHGIEQWLLHISQPVHFGAGDFKMTLLLKNEIVGLILGSRARKEVLSLLRGKPGARSIIQAPRFIEAMSQVDAPEDGYTFFDARTLIDDVRNAAMKLLAKESKLESDSPAAPIIKAALKLVDIYDYMITSVRTDGMQQHVQTVMCIQPGKKRAPLTRMIYDRRPFDRFDKYIPVDAVSFSVDNNVDVGKGYHLLRHFISERIPNGVKMLSKFDDLQEKIGFNIDRDVLSWLSGETISVTLPASTTSPMSQHDTVVFIRVKDPEAAYKKVNQAMTFITEKLREIGQPVFVREVDTPCGKCCEVTHPLLAMIGSPVIGVTDNWLYISNTMESVNRCMAVARGEAPSILKNKRFLREGLIPEGPVQSLSFTDRRYVGREMAQIVTAMHEVSRVIPAVLIKKQKRFVVEDVQKNLKHLEIATHLLSAFGKLPPVLKEINFYSSESTYCTFDGQYSRSHGLINYRDPEDDLSDEPSVVNIEINASP